MIPEHRVELRAQITAQPDLAIDLLSHLSEVADKAAGLSARIRDDELKIAAQAEVIKSLATAAAATLRECVGRPVGAGDRLSIAKPSWKTLNELANAVALTLTPPPKP